MTSFHAIILGILQGATEFLPISSSGHLVVAEYFLGFREPILTFDVALHLGTLFSVLTYFWHDWLEIFRSFLPGNSSSLKPKRLFFYLIMGTIPGAAAGFFLESLTSSSWRSPWVVVVTLAGVGLLLGVAEWQADHKRNFAAFSLKDALLVGIAQAFALIPGVSRSGITMTAALFLGFNRTAAARFSFLLSAPIIAGAGLYQGLKLAEQGLDQLSIAYLWGFLAAFLSGYAVIAGLLRYVTNHSFYPFVVYRLLLAAVVAVTLLIS